MEKPIIAVLGATGLVGREMLRILEEENVPCREVRLLASSKSQGKEIIFKGKKLIVQELDENAFEGVDIVLASAGGEISQKFAPIAVKKGAVFIDNSSIHRLFLDVPLVVVGVNEEALFNHRGIIANPNCSTAQLMPVLKPLHAYASIKRLIVSTYQAVSGAGKKAVDELKENTLADLEGLPFKNKIFKKNIAFNVIPQIDSFCENAYTKEEMKLINETKKILNLKQETPITCTAVRVPVLNSHSESVSVEFEKEISPEKAREILNNTWEVRVLDDFQKEGYPTPIEVSGKNPVYVGRIRKDLAFERGLSFWCVGDNLRIGAALNAVRIAQKLIEKNLIRKK